MMFWGSLSFIFEVMIYVGLGLPLANLLLGQLGSGADGAPEMDADVGGDFSGDLGADVDLDFDAPDLDLDAFGADAAADLGEVELSGEAEVPAGMPLRFNIYCLCLSLVVMGAIGVFAMETQSGLPQFFTIASGFVLALAAYALLYRFVIGPLKTNDAAALRSKDLQYRHAKVSFRILPDSPGKIETTDAVGAAISYRAEMDTDICKTDRIDEGEEVVITEIFPEQGLCYVTVPTRKRLT